MLQSFPADSRACVVGASRGIGLEFVRQLLDEPAFGRVHAACRNPGAAQELQALAAAQPRLELHALDVGDEGSVAAAAATVLAESPRLHLLLNCAGVLHDAPRGLQPERRLAEVHAGALAQAFAVNAAGPLLLARAFEPGFAHRERALYASLSARLGSIGDNRLGGWYAYRASKAAQNMALKTLAIEWARSRRNVVVAALHPGTTDTALSRPFQAGVPPERLFSTERCVRQLLAVLDGLQPADSGRFLGWDGRDLPW